MSSIGTISPPATSSGLAEWPHIIWGLSGSTRDHFRLPSMSKQVATRLPKTVQTRRPSVIGVAVV
ncbi:MAG: hypothetical protein Ct9H300mP1_09710 [Planctomycetaceae bacterium]|nr:MAG: hypothetical protein Ct9H300mP1_09710 [Planctomycetaceae bacterium]